MHHRLNARNWAQEPMLVEKTWAEAETMLLDRTQIRVPSLHAVFLHIVEHATLHHLFENGPMTLADMHFMAAGGEIDWDRLLDEAEAMGLQRSLRFMAGFAAHLGATWVPERLAVPAADMQDYLAIASEAIVRDGASANHHAFLRAIEIRSGAEATWTTALTASLRPSRFSLAEILGVRPDNPLRWIAYPVWVVQRFAKFASARLSVRRGAAEREKAFSDWLQGQ